MELTLNTSALLVDISDLSILIVSGIHSNDIEPSLLPIISYGSEMLKRISYRKLRLLRLPLMLPHGVLLRTGKFLFEFEFFEIIGGGYSPLAPPAPRSLVHLAEQCISVYIIIHLQNEISQIQNPLPALEEESGPGCNKLHMMPMAPLFLSQEF